MIQPNKLPVQPLSLGKRKVVNKYGNVKTADGHDSIKEGDRARELRLMEQAGQISNLREQVDFLLIPKQYDRAPDGEKTKRGRPRVIEHACSYRADFVYIDNATGAEVVEDAKGVRTPDYVIKRKLMLFLRGIRIKEV